MPAFCIIETEDGWTVVEQNEGASAEETAELHGGILIDAGPYSCYDDAYDALLAAQQELMDDESSDTPGTRALEDRAGPDD